MLPRDIYYGSKLSRYVYYRDKRLKLLSFDDALVEYDAQKAQGKKPAVVSVQDGYIVTEAVFHKEGLDFDQEGGE